MADEADFANDLMAEATARNIAAVLACLPSGESAEECVECGAEIPQARREAVPGVELCVECAAIREVRRG